MACGQAATSPSTGPTAAPTAGQPSATTDATAPPASTEAPAGLRLETVATGLASPVDVLPSDDGTGRIFVVEQGGRIRVVRDGALVEQPFLDISKRLSSGGERGLLGLALHPKFPDDPRFFVDYTDLDGNTVISSFTLSLDADSADPESERVLMHIEQPFPNHNGGAVVFGPDGMLYIAMGDGGSGGDPQGNGQRLDTHLAKILRIDVDVPAGQDPGYAVPPDNPFVKTAGALPEIWHTGVRNPWRIRFDPANGDLWIGDVGQNAWEEIDVARSGQGGLNFGWNTMEGFECFNPSDGCDPAGLTLPLAAYGHDLGCAVVGGVVVHDPAQTTDRREVRVLRQLLGQHLDDGRGRRRTTRADPGPQRPSQHQLDRLRPTTAPSTWSISPGSCCASLAADDRSRPPARRPVRRSGR